ncbi:hypothetical protein EC991_003109 [Linnemannia zychae]|nr:hypothetical protein EC991_003109 [Linnemannia zychae]
MARMEMRSREAPMEWEREQDRNVPNIFANPQQQPTDSSLLTTTPATSNQQQRPFGFGGAQRESSFASLSSQGSFSSNNNGWGATTPKPFRQDSQLSAGNGAGATTLRQDSFSFGQGGVGGSFSRPQSPNNTASQGFISTSATVIGRDGSRTVAHEGEIMDVDRDHSTAQGARTGSAEPFDMELLRNGVAVGLGTSPRRMLGKTHSSASYRESSVLHGSRTSSMQYRGSGAAGTGKGASFWSDDDNDGEDTNEIEEDDDEDAYGRRGSGRSLAYNMQPRNTGSRRRLRDLDNSERRRSDHVRSPPAQGRVWTENVDLPYIISGYVQVAMNSAFVAMMIYIIYNFITTIQNDVTIRAEDALNRELQIIKNCKTDYLANKCNLPHGPLLVGPCESLLACYTRDTPRIERSAVAAQTFALIFNSFVHTISYKTMWRIVVKQEYDRRCRWITFVEYF